MTSQAPSRRRLAAAGLLALAGAAAVVASATLDERAELAPAARDVPVNAGSRDPSDIRSNNSPTLAQHPRRPATLAIVNRVDTPGYSCALHVSRDRGLRWSRVAIPIPRGEEPKCYAPDAVFAADGTLYVSYVTLRGRGNQPHAVWLARSPDGGRTLAAPRRVSGPLAFQVRLNADPRRPKRLYMSWLQAADVGLYLFAGGDHRIEVTRSDDGGRSWSRPVRASDARRERPLAPVPAVGPGGELYVLYLDVGEDRLDYEGGHGASGGPPYSGRFALVLGRSTDAGASWQESLVDDRIVPTRRFIAFLPPFPSLAVDPRSGRVYAAFEDGRRSPSDVYVWSLPRGARTWKGPTRVNDTAANDRTSQYLPRIAVAPDGRLDVAYYDRRADRTNRRNEVALQSSIDAGATFSRHVMLTGRSFDSRIGAGSERGLADLGSRLGLVSDHGSAFAAWTDTRAGTVASNKQDIAFARADVERSRPRTARAALLAGGVVALLAAFALALAVARDRRRTSG